MTTTAGPITHDDPVVYLGRRWTVAFINFNVTACPTHKADYCRKLDLTSGDITRQGIRECQVVPAPAEPADVHRSRKRDAAHATITLTPCEGPERRWLIAVCYPGTTRMVRDGDRDMTYSVADYDAAAELGNALWALFSTLTTAQALDALPALRTVLRLAA